MSKQNVLRFLDQVSRNDELNEKLASAEMTASAWTDAACTAGFDFTVEELRAVAEVVLEKAPEGEGFVSEFLGTDELGNDELEAVAGGVTRVPTRQLRIKPFLAQRLLNLGANWGAGKDPHVRRGGPTGVGPGR